MNDWSSARSMRLGVILFAAWLACPGATAQQPSPHAIDIPPWFATTFLDFREDVDDAAREGKRVLVYFGQDGCPYCAKLMTSNFSQRPIVDKTRRHFVPIALNLWGDRDVKWIDGRAMSEKALGRVLDVQFTPTILILDEAGRVIVRLNGYYPPQQFEAVLDYAARKLEKQSTLAEHLRVAVKEKARPTLNPQPFLMKPPHDFARRPGDRPLAVIFETVDCSTCDEMHRDAFRRSDVMAQVRRFDVARFSLADQQAIIAPDGRPLTAREWARELGIAYTPSVVFFDAGGVEVFRTSAYFRPFHFAATFAYVADGGYRSEPSFQRWLQARAETMRKRGERVDLME